MDKTGLRFAFHRIKSNASKIQDKASYRETGNPQVSKIGIQCRSTDAKLQVRQDSRRQYKMPAATKDSSGVASRFAFQSSSTFIDHKDSRKNHAVSRTTLSG